MAMRPVYEAAAQFQGQAYATAADTKAVRIRFAIGVVAALALLALPAAASANGGQGNPQVTGLAAQQCAQERSDIGKRAFRKKYGAKRTMRSCVRRTQPQVSAVVPAANTDCQDELASETPADFIDEYGDDPSTPLADAMAECIAEDVDQILNPQDYVDDGTDG
jgi:hypothetical protein